MEHKPYTRATPEEIKLRVGEVEKHLKDGMKPPQIAEKMGLGVGRVYAVIRENPQLKPKAAAKRIIAKSGKSLGALGAALAGHDADFVAWLVAQVPEDGSIADVVIACAQDAFVEETGAGADLDAKAAS